MYKIFKTKSKW